jgi:hypothetical protein
MELFYRLAIDAGLVIFLMLSTIIGNIVVSCTWVLIIRMPLGLQSLSFHSIGLLNIIFIGIPSFSPVMFTSYFGGNIAYNITHDFNYLDTTLISSSCFICMFIIMEGLKISEDLQMWSHYSWWERIDQSLTPAAIVTLFITSGLILSCYFNGLN